MKTGKMWLGADNEAGGVCPASKLSPSLVRNVAKIESPLGGIGGKREEDSFFKIRHVRTDADVNLLMPSNKIHNLQ